MPAALSKPEWAALLSRLEDHFAVFATLYAIARPVMTEKVPTAAVTFNRAGNCLDFLINPEYWATLSMDQKTFVMSHEAMHVFLNHGTRIKDGRPAEAMARNIALDVVVNHLLTDRFGHSRKKVDPKSAYCWRDTIFKKPVKRDQNYEYYLGQLKERMKAGGEGKDGKGGGDGEGKAGGSGQPGEGDAQGVEGGELINDHSNLRSLEGKDKDGETGKAMRDLLKRSLGRPALEELASKLAGTEAGDLLKTIEEMKVVPKRKWETVIKQWSMRFAAEEDVPQFVLTNRRYALMPRSTTFLPTDSEHEGFDRNREEVWFFMDTSGSCVHLAERFFAAALSLPKDRFKVRLFCFDTQVYDVDPIKRQLAGFGGTSFSCVETAIQQRVTFEGISYPRQVWVISDGDSSDQVAPERPERWQFFLSWDHRGCIPAGAKVWALNQFE